MRRFTILTSLVLLAGCDAAATAGAETKTEVAVEGAAPVAVVGEADAAASADAAVAVDGKVEIAADAFKLDQVTTLVQEGRIESAADLEMAINDPESEINRIDIDVDGKVDHVEVIEVRSDATAEASAKVDFQLRVIPSSRATVTHAVHLATASVVAAKASSQVSFSASFSAGVSFTGGVSASAQAYSFVAPARFEATTVVVAQPLFSWVFVASRPVYHSIYIEEKSGKWIPPGHVKHGLWKATGEARGGGKGKIALDVGGHGGGHGKVDVGGSAKAKGKADVDDRGGSSKPGNSGGGSKGSSKSSGPAPKQASKPEPKSSGSSKSSGGGGSSKSSGGGGSSKSGGGGGGGSSKSGGGGGGGKGKGK